MHLPSAEIDGVTVITLDGAILGGPEAGALNDEVHRLIDQGKLKVVVDLSRVTLMNSSGLGMLIGGYTTLKNAGGDLKLAHLNQNLQHLSTISKLQSIFAPYETVDEAVASFL